MFRKVTIITDTGLEKSFKESSPVGAAYFQAYLRALKVVTWVVARADKPPLWPTTTSEGLAWLEDPNSVWYKELVQALQDCTRVEAVIKLLHSSRQALEADISMFKGKSRYGFVQVTIAVFGKEGLDDLAYATSSWCNLVRS